MDIIRFNESDVIVASGAAGKTARIVGIDSTPNNLAISLGSGDTFSYLTDSGTEFSIALNDYLGVEGQFNTNNDVKFYVYRGGGYFTLASAGTLGGQDLGGNNWDYYNGSYTWYPSLGDHGAFYRTGQ